MSAPSSSLSRLLVLFERVTSRDSNSPTIQQWAEALGIVRANVALSQQDARKALRAMALMSEELERGRLSLRATPLQVSDYEAAFNRLQKSIDVQQLNVPWSNIRVDVTSETMSILRLCSRVSPATEQLLDTTELEAVDGAMKELDDALRDLVATDGLARVLVEQLETMRQARIDYQIGGASVLRRAVYGLDGAVVNQAAPETAAANAETPAHAKVFLAAYRLSRAVKIALTTAGAVAAFGAGVEGALHIADATATAQIFYLDSGPPLDDQSAKDASHGGTP